MSDSILQVNQIKDKGGNAVGITVADSTANISIGTTLAVNTINEVTSANGVTIDGLSLKDGNVAPASGKGIEFNSGGDSSLLDDYEEGTYNPSITGSGGAPSGVNFTTRLGKYTKIGNMIHVSIHLNVASQSSGPSGSLWCSLPVNAGSNYVPAATVGYTNGWNKAPYRAIVAGSTDRLYLYVHNATGSANITPSTGFTNADGADQQSGFEIFLQASYHI